MSASAFCLGGCGAPVRGSVLCGTCSYWAAVYDELEAIGAVREELRDGVTVTPDAQRSRLAAELAEHKRRLGLRINLRTRRAIESPPLAEVIDMMAAAKRLVHKRRRRKGLTP